MRSGSPLGWRARRATFPPAMVPAVLASLVAVGFHSPAAVGASSPSYVRTPLSMQTTTVKITDPSLNDMPAATLTIPAGWKLQGIMMIAPCTTIPWPVFRAYSADGLMQYRMQPVVAWQWGTSRNGNDCLPLNGAMSAAAFLRVYAGMIEGGVHVVGPMPVPQKFTQFANRLAASDNAQKERMAPALRRTSTADTAALEVETVNRSFVVDERLKAVVLCTQPDSPQGMLGSRCWARVDVLSAPKGQLAKLVRVVDENNLPHGVTTPEWEQAALQRQEQQGNAMLAMLTEQEQQASRMLYNQFQQNMARMRNEHEQFMQQQESSFRSAMANADASMNAQSTAASDWVDYALDQQTVMNPNGTTTKVSSQYSHTWTNGSQWFQTNNPNTDPNGMLNGNWTQTSKVHGNGTSY